MQPKLLWYHSNQKQNYYFLCYWKIGEYQVRCTYWLPAIRSLEPVPKWETLSGHHRNGDVPVVGHPPPGFTRSAITWVSQRPRPCSWRRTDGSGGRSQRQECYTSWWWRWSTYWEINFHFCAIPCARRSVCHLFQVSLSSANLLTSS